MVSYITSENMLVDYIRHEYQGTLDLRVSDEQCALLEFSNGKKCFYDTGDHMISLTKNNSLFKRHETVNLFWLNLSDHIELRLFDTIKVMEQLLKNLAPELKTFHPVDVRVMTEITVSIEDREKLLSFLCSRQNPDNRPVLDTARLEQLLIRRLHDKLEDSVNEYKMQFSAGIFDLNTLSEYIEVALIDDIYSVLNALGLDLVAAHIAKIGPTKAGYAEFHKKEEETIDWYNRIQMEQFMKKNSRVKRKNTKQTEKQDLLKVS